MSGRHLLIVGAGEFGQMAVEYFEADSPWKVVGFGVEREWLKRGSDACMGIPIVPLDEVPRRFPFNTCDVFVAVTYAHMNDERKRICGIVEAMGYQLASYVSSRAYVGAGAKIEPGAMVMEMSSVQRGARVGRGAVMWSGCTVAHKSSVGDFCWLAPAATVAGMSSVGTCSFLGAGCVVGDNVSVADRSLVGAGAVVTHDVEEAGCAWAGSPLRQLAPNVYERFARSSKMQKTRQER